MRDRPPLLRLLLSSLVVANVVVALQFIPRPARAEQNMDRECGYAQGCNGGTGCFLCMIASPATCKYDGDCTQY